MRLTQRLPGLAVVIVRSDGQPQVYVSGERPPTNPSPGFVMGWSVMPRDGVQSHEQVGSYGAYVAYATIQPSRDLAVGAFTNLGGGQDLRDAVARVAWQIATRLSTDKKSD